MYFHYRAIYKPIYPELKNLNKGLIGNMNPRTEEQNKWLNYYNRRKGFFE